MKLVPFVMIMAIYVIVSTIIIYTIYHNVSVTFGIIIVMVVSLTKTLQSLSSLSVVLPQARSERVIMLGSSS